MRKLIPVLCLVFSPMTTIGQESEFVGEWLLWLERGNAGRPAYGTLSIEPAGDSVGLYIDGGPVNLLSLEGDRIRFDFDWTDVGDREHVSILEGVLDDGILTGTMTEEGEPRGAWRATPRAAPESPPSAPDPVDLTGIWGGPAIISKFSFDQTEAGRAAHAAYDLTIDDPILRCVSDGLIRMSHGPFVIEVGEVEGVVVEVFWANPHVHYYIEVTEADGSTRIWDLESSNLNGMARAGWTRDTIEVGDRIRASGMMGREGRPRLALDRDTLEVLE